MSYNRTRVLPGLSYLILPGHYYRLYTAHLQCYAPGTLYNTYIPGTTCFSGLSYYNSGGYSYNSSSIFTTCAIIVDSSSDSAQLHVLKRELCYNKRLIDELLRTYHKYSIVVAYDLSIYQVQVRTVNNKNTNKQGLRMGTGIRIRKLKYS